MRMETTHKTMIVRTEAIHEVLIVQISSQIVFLVVQSFGNFGEEPIHYVKMLLEEPKGKIFNSDYVQLLY